mmetsp:Transcript_50014/g.132185  ORF Transcript_50014/g.132185 Transcript_50014/m.132185 type:complete len:126 (+) Transcript_50014:79-456(+)
MVARARSTAFSALLAVAAACLLASAFAPTSFIQARSAKGPEAAVAGALVSLASSLPAEAYSFTGPLTGSEVCTSKPLVWFIYPLCDPIFIVSPLYLFPILLIIFGGGITVLNLLIPATQPDEDLR